MTESAEKPRTEDTRSWTIALIGTLEENDQAKIVRAAEAMEAEKRTGHKILHIENPDRPSSVYDLETKKKVSDGGAPRWNELLRPETLNKINAIIICDVDWADETGTQRLESTDVMQMIVDAGYKGPIFTASADWKMNVRMTQNGARPQTIHWESLHHILASALVLS